MTNINNNEDLKNVNSINNTTSQVNNNPILNDEEKAINLIRQIVEQKVTHDIPESFDMISESTFSKMQGIDKMYQSNFISRDIAIEMMADLVEGDAIRSRYERFADDMYLEKLKKLYKLMEIRRQDLLNALNTGKIDQKEFMERYSKLRELQGNSISELIESDETRRQHNR